MRVEIDDKSGFCFGVVRAIDKAERALADYGTVYSLGDIVHNRIEVQRLEGLGLHTVTHADLDGLGGRRLFIRLRIIQQPVRMNAQRICQRQQFGSLRLRIAGLPFADRLSGNADSGGQILLGKSFPFPAVSNFLIQLLYDPLHHLRSSQFRKCNC